MNHPPPKHGRITPRVAIGDRYLLRSGNVVDVRKLANGEAHCVYAEGLAGSLAFVCTYLLRSAQCLNRAAA